jgi:iron complex outermembrane receptor protein
VSTTRSGFELGYAGQWLESLRVTAAFTALDARFENGNRLPGTPPRSAFAEAAWTSRGFMEAAMEVVHVGRLYVNDANEDSAAAATVLNLRAGMKLAWGALEVRPLVRLENATGRAYAGSVIVNEANRRFFEPAPPRNWRAAVTVRYSF